MTENSDDRIDRLEAKLAITHNLLLASLKVLGGSSHSSVEKFVHEIVETTQLEMAHTDIPERNFEAYRLYQERLESLKDDVKEDLARVLRLKDQPTKSG